jgi:hypothetical protein
MSVTVTLTVSCKEHPKYKGVKHPHVTDGCWTCWDVYDVRQLGGTFKPVVEKFEVHK